MVIDIYMAVFVCSVPEQGTFFGISVKALGLAAFQFPMQRCKGMQTLQT